MSFAVTAIVAAGALTASTVHSIETQKEMGRQAGQQREAAMREAKKKEDEFKRQEETKRLTREANVRNKAIREARRGGSGTSSISKFGAIANNQQLNTLLGGGFNQSGQQSPLKTILGA